MERLMARAAPIHSTIRLYTTNIAVNLQTGLATGVNGFRSIENLIGGSGANALTGVDTDNTWHITSTNTGDVNGVTFTGFGTLTGGAATDTFIFSDGVGVTGAIGGGAGTNTLNYAAYSTNVDVNLQTQTAPGLTKFDHIRASSAAAATTR